MVVWMTQPDTRSLKSLHVLEFTPNGKFQIIKFNTMLKDVNCFIIHGELQELLVWVKAPCPKKIVN